MIITEVIIHPFGEIESHLLEAVRAAIAQRFGISVIAGCD